MSSITENDSRTALSQLIQEEIEREMLMASNEKQDLRSRLSLVESKFQKST